MSLRYGSRFKLDKFKVVRGDPSRETAIVEHCGDEQRDSRYVRRDSRVKASKSIQRAESTVELGIAKDELGGRTR